MHDAPCAKCGKTAQLGDYHLCPPCAAAHNGNQRVAVVLTKREHFAALAMQGLCANGDISRAASERGISPADLRTSFASSSVHMAAALLLALEEPKPDS